MDVLVDTADAFQRRRQGSWLHDLHDEVKKLHQLSDEVNRHYAATLATLKSIAHTYESINALLVSVSRNFSEVSVGSRIGVGTNVQKFSNLVTTMGESPQGREVQRLLKEQIRDAEELKHLVKHSFAALKERDQQYSSLSAAAKPSHAQRTRQLDTEAKLGKEVRAIYCGASRVVDKECIGFVRAWTGGASAVIQLVRDRYTRSLLAATDAVGTSHGYPATGVVQQPDLAQNSPAPIRPPHNDAHAGEYGVNQNEYVSDGGSDVPVAVQPPSPMLLAGPQRRDAGMALEFAS